VAKERGERGFDIGRREEKRDRGVGYATGCERGMIEGYAAAGGVSGRV